MDVGLLIVRVVVGLLFIGHGTQKLFGWFGGGGRHGTGEHFGSLGYRPGRTWATLAGLAETSGGISLAMGMLTPLGATAIIGVMVNAIISVHFRSGMWAQNGGMEYPLVLIAVASALAYVGPGAWSVDDALTLAPSGSVAGTVALVAGTVIGLMVAATRGRPPTAGQTHTEHRRAA